MKLKLEIMLGKVLRALSLFAHYYLPYTSEIHVESNNKKNSMNLVK
jgi:hypothetical protein